MGRTKGTTKTGGRKKGTPNKKTKDTKAWIEKMVFNNQAEFEERFNKLPDNEFVRNYMQLLNYIVPKQSPITPDDMIKKEREMLQGLLFSQSEEAIKQVATKLYELNTKK